MAKKRTKRSDLHDLRPVPCAYVATLSEDGPLHLITEMGDVHYNTISGTRVSTSRYSVTACKRLTRYPHRQKSIEYSRLCERCGTVADFEQAVEDWKRYVADVHFKRNQEKAMKDAEFKAEMTWTKLGKAIEENIMVEAQTLVDNGFVFVPFSQTGLSQMRMVLKRYLRDREHDVRQFGLYNDHTAHAKNLLEHLEDYK
jgi:hypothetical protein